MRSCFAAALVLSLPLPLAAITAPAPARAAPAPTAPTAGIPVVADATTPRHQSFGTSRLGLKDQQLRRAGSKLAGGAKSRVADGPDTPPIGTVRRWLGLDDVEGDLYRKDYTLRAVGEHIEVWIADDLAFPAGDCRPKSSTEVTDAQIAGLVHEFDRAIYPREIAAFSKPMDRNGTDPLLSGDFTGAGDRTVTLVDNVRDDNYFEFPQAPTYVAGFFSAQINELVDRNVMTIDAYDWRHRTGATPPDEPTSDLCTSRPERPRMYEGTFAHEWQHLLQSYTDPDEKPWVNEGLSDYAQTLVGYVDAAATVHHPGPDPHLTCFQGFAVVRTAFNANPRECGGPQGSLNLWGEGEPSEVLADYGHVYQFMLYLKDRFGAEVLSRLHRDGAHQGLAGVRAALGDADLFDVLHDFRTMSLVDKVIGNDAKLSTASLRATVNLDNPASYARPGAAPNGADYVRLRDAHGRGLSGADLDSVRFAGAATLPPLPLPWSVRDGALWSGDGNKMDSTAVVRVEVPADDAVLRLRASYGAEDGYDYGYVTVSTDGGRTYTVIAGDKTAQGPLGPGVTGDSGGFTPHTYDLSAYAGRAVLLGFRYVSDSAVHQGGWFVDDVTVGGRVISDGSTLADFRSPTQIEPIEVHAWHVRLVGIDAAAHQVRVVPVARFAELRAYPKVVAIAGYDEPTERIDQYAPYALTVNGVLQPGGS